jgi:hypothetical protein
MARGDCILMMMMLFMTIEMMMYNYAYYDDRDDDIDHKSYCGGEHVSSISVNLL